MVLGDTPLPIVYTFGLQAGITMLNETFKDLIEVVKRTSSDILKSIDSIEKTITTETNPTLTTLSNVANTTYTYLYNNVGLIRGQLTLIDASNNIEQTLSKTLLSTNQLVVNTQATVDSLKHLEVNVKNAVVVTNDITHPALNVVFEV